MVVEVGLLACVRAVPCCSVLLWAVCCAVVVVVWVGLGLQLPVLIGHHAQGHDITQQRIHERSAWELGLEVREHAASFLPQRTLVTNICCIYISLLLPRYATS